MMKNDFYYTVSTCFDSPYLPDAWKIDAALEAARWLPTGPESTDLRNPPPQFPEAPLIGVAK